MIDIEKEKETQDRIARWPSVDDSKKADGVVLCSVNFTV